MSKNFERRVYRSTKLSIEPQVTETKEDERGTAKKFRISGLFKKSFLGVAFQSKLAETVVSGTAQLFYKQLINRYSVR